MRTYEEKPTKNIEELMRTESYQIDNVRLWLCSLVYYVYKDLASGNQSKHPSWKKDTEEKKR